MMTIHHHHSDRDTEKGLPFLCSMFSSSRARWGVCGIALWFSCGLVYFSNVCVRCTVMNKKASFCAHSTIVFEKKMNTWFYVTTWTKSAPTSWRKALICFLFYIHLDLHFVAGYTIYLQVWATSPNGLTRSHLIDWFNINFFSLFEYSRPEEPRWNFMAVWWQDCAQWCKTQCVENIIIFMYIL